VEWTSFARQHHATTCEKEEKRGAGPLGWFSNWATTSNNSSKLRISRSVDANSEAGIRQAKLTRSASESPVIRAYFG
jgi:hypothetical protein